MKKAILIGLILGVAVVQGCMEKKVDLTKEDAKYGYAIGVNIGSSMRAQNLPIDADALAIGILDSLTATPQMTEDAVKTALKEFETKQREKFEADMKIAGERNKKEGEDFLAINKQKPGVNLTESGLQYQVVNRGTGKVSPKASDTVLVHYRGTLIDGQEFDSSYKRKEPIKFPVNGVIPGWSEALQLMKVGDKYKIFIPSDQAYGERSAGPKIGPNSTLVFDVELLEINPKP